MPHRQSRRIQVQEGAEILPLIRRGTRIFVVLLWLMGLGAAAVASWLLLARAEAETQATARSIEQYARRSMEIGDFVADEFAAFLDRRGSIEGLGADAAVAAELARLTARLPEGSATIFVRTDGQVAASSSKLPPGGVNLSDRAWFKAHTEQGETTVIGPAIHSRVVDRIIYTFSRSYVSPAGTLRGMINLGIPSDSLIGLSPNAARMPVALMQDDGVLVAAQPITDAMLGKPLAIASLVPGDAAEVTRYVTVFGRLSVVTLRRLGENGIAAIAAAPLAGVLRPAAWGVALGVPTLLLLTAVMLNLSRLAQRKGNEVEQALADNRVLFQEVHHRVKNNLQVISSLIRLQTERVPEDLKPFMDQTAARVRAIAMVHEQIYSTSSPSVVQLDAFLRLLIQNIEASMLEASGARLAVRLEPLTISLDTAVPVALLATEAITNALKHGTAAAGSEIEVSLRSEAGQNILDVEDRGAGPGGETRGGLGTRIMTALARQIDGEWTLEPRAGGGTRSRLTWPSREAAR